MVYTREKLQRIRTENKAANPRIHEVKNCSPVNYPFKLRTDYDQRLWPVPGQKQ